MKHEYYVYVTIGYTGRFVEVSKDEFISVVEMAKRKFDCDVVRDECLSFRTEKWYATVEYTSTDIVREQFALMRTLK